MKRTSSHDYATMSISDDQGKGFLAMGTSADKLSREESSYLEVIAPAKLTEVGCLLLFCLKCPQLQITEILMKFINNVFN